MKKTLLTTALIATLGTALVHAATDSAAVTQSVEQMKTEFNLSDQQARQVSNILSRAATPDAAKAEQRAARMEQRMERRLSRLKEKLSLTDEQVATLKTTMTQQRTQMQTLREQGKANMLAVLTPEQAAKFEAMQGERMERGGQRSRGGRGGHERGHGMNKMHRGQGMQDGKAAAAE
jgi:chromosome segregation ATPase